MGIGQPQMQWKQGSLDTKTGQEKDQGHPDHMGPVLPDLGQLLGGKTHIQMPGDYIYKTDSTQYQGRAKGSQYQIPEGCFSTQGVIP